MEQEKEKRLILAYVAGLIDGDGSIHVVPPKNNNCVAVTHISIAVSKNPVMTFLLDNFGGIVSKSRNLHKWSLRRKKESFDFLNSIKDFLIEKREIAIQAMKGDFQEVRRLNKYTCQDFVEIDSFFKSDKESYAYLAGFLDADGHITIKKRNRDSIKKKRNYADYSIEIGCGGTDFRATNFIYKFLNIGSMKIRPHKKCVNGKRLDFRVRIHEESKEFLKNIYPYLIIKKENASVAIEYLEGYKAKKGGNDHTIPDDQIEHREKCYQKMKSLQIRK